MCTRKLIRILMFTLAAITSIAVISFSGGIPNTLNYQGTLTDSTGKPVTAPAKPVTFSLYTTALGGTAFWTEPQTIPITNGQFSAVFGNRSTNTLPTDKFTGNTFVGVTIANGPEMLPRQKITSVAYALKAADAIPKGVIVMWSGAVNQVPAGWALCDGANSTPDLRDRFIVGAGNNYTVGGMGGDAAHVITENEMPPHNHGGSTGGHSADHNHSGVLTSVNRDGSSGSRVREADPNGTFGGVSYTTGGASNNHTHPVATQGGGVAFDNRPPYYALAFIMKL